MCLFGCMATGLESSLRAQRVGSLVLEDSSTSSDAFSVRQRQYFQQLLLLNHEDQILDAEKLQLSNGKCDAYFWKGSMRSVISGAYIGPRLRNI